MCLGRSRWTHQISHRSLFDAQGCTLEGYDPATQIAIPGSQVGGRVQGSPRAIHQTIGVKWINVHTLDHPAELDRGYGRFRVGVAKVEPGGIRGVDGVVKIAIRIRACPAPDGFPGSAAIGAAKELRIWPVRVNTGYHDRARYKLPDIAMPTIIGTVPVAIGDIERSLRVEFSLMRQITGRCIRTGRP